MKFSELELNPALVAGLDKLNFTECTPVQSATIPHILAGRDVAGLAQTGTGKTAAFLLPLMDRILASRQNPAELNEEDKKSYEVRAFPEWRHNQFVLVLVPTRELAEQVYENVLTLRGETDMRAVSIYGGVSYDKQKQALREGIEFIVATPGRLIDLYKENLVDLKQVRAIVFDEADRMFDMGFKDDMKYILQRVPKERQFLVFSATLNLDVMTVAYQFGANPIDIDVSRDQAKAENVEDKIFHVGQDEKAMYLLSLLKVHNPRQVIIFSNFKMNVERIASFLSANGIPAVGISSLLTQAQRNRVMEQFKGDSDKNVMVATDVAARGLDIKGVDMVINFELPDDPENYVHRIGRTGRAGAKGVAFSLVSDRDVDALSRIEDYLKHKVDTGWLDDEQLIRDFAAFTSDDNQRRMRGGGGGRGGPRAGGRPAGGGRDGRRDDGRRDRGGRGGGRDRDRRPRGEQMEAAGGEGRREGRRDEGRRAGGEGRRDDQRRQEQRGGQPQQHRDKLMGRHRGRVEGLPDQPRETMRGERGDRPERGGRGGQQQRGGRPDRRDRGNGRHHGQQQQGRSRQERQQQQAPPPKSIGEKVSSFFKRLFK